MKDVIFIGGCLTIIGGFGVVNMALNSHAEKQELRNRIEVLEQENRDLTNRLLGSYSN